MTVWALGLAYNGSSFNGWQRQPDLPTVQGELERAISKIADHRVTVTVAGRTDKGVHATGQVVHFSTPTLRAEANWLQGLNGLTPPTIQVLWARAVDERFHARYAAVSRTYTYLFLPDAAVRGDVFLHDYMWAVGAVKVDRMHQQAQALLGEHDFTSFRGAGCQSVTAMRRINRVAVRRHGPFVVLEIEANAFLLHMVRNIAATLAAIGSGEERRSVRQLLALQNRQALGLTAPPQGLYLTTVRYPEFDFPVALPPAWIRANSPFIPSVSPLD